MKRTIVQNGNVRFEDGGNGYLLENNTYFHFDPDQTATMEVTITNTGSSDEDVVIDFNYLRIL